MAVSTVHGLLKIIIMGVLLVIFSGQKMGRYLHM